MLWTDDFTQDFKMSCGGDSNTATVLRCFWNDLLRELQTKMRRGHWCVTPSYLKYTGLP